MNFFEGLLENTFRLFHYLKIKIFYTFDKIYQNNEKKLKI
jgi:hypothetical protein